MLEEWQKEAIQQQDDIANDPDYQSLNHDDPLVVNENADNSNNN